MNSFERGDKITLVASNPVLKRSLIEAATEAASSIKGMRGVILSVSGDIYRVGVPRGVWMKGPDGVVRRLRVVHETVGHLKPR